ncbi:MAG: UDP-N-acetylmuramoyl-tripeptide--D-alanyl-D-alanine ligase [Clostridia bacterium]|nr:UDP-N-acetylmuramoyl-tripeptide--D-alanyl-D-alanine ligase [Clostridia bacterium]
MLKISEIVKATGGELLFGCEDNVIENIVTDSRQAVKGTLFAAIKGENADGHDYIKKAAELGMSAVLCEKDIPFIEGAAAIKTDNTVRALGKIAKYYLSTLSVKKVAVTGSVGKTTTKDMIYAVLSGKGKALKTLGNFNNELGLPLTVFRLTKEEEFAVLEMGMSEFGEISYLSEIARPEIAVISNIGHSHIENLGSQEGILKAKCEIADYMDENGVIIMNGDDALLYSVKNNFKQKTVYFGVKNPDCDYVAQIESVDEKSTTFVLNGETYTVGTPGIHNVYNALSAIITGELLGVEREKIKSGIENFEQTGMRMEMKEVNGYTLLVDCYNSSPDSIRAGLNVLSNMKSCERRIAVLGSVRELGDKRDELLFEVGEYLADGRADLLVTVGEDALAINKGAEAKGFCNHVNLKDNAEASEYLKNILENGDAVLIKASRYYKFEEIADSLATV